MTTGPGRVPAGAPGTPIPAAATLLELHVHALFALNPDLRLRTINEPRGDGGPAPRFFLGRTPEGNLWRFRHDVPDTLVEQLEALCQAEPVSADVSAEPRHRGRYLDLLQAHAPIQEVHLGPAYLVPPVTKPPADVVAVTRENPGLLRGGFDWLIPGIADEQPCLALVRGGRALSVCRSVRITPQAHEAGIETLEAFRGRGHAVEALAGWAAAVRRMGCVPLYSTDWGNAASLRVAKKAGLALYGVTFAVT